MEFIIFIHFIHFNFIDSIDKEIFSDQMKFFEQLRQNLKINIKLVDLKEQVINSTHFGAPKRIRIWYPTGGVQWDNLQFFGTKFLTRG